MSIENFFIAGGIVAWPLLGFSIVSVALIVERLYFWLTVNRHQRRVIQSVLRTYQAEPYDAIARLRQNSKLPICRIFLEALELDRPTPEEFRLALESASQAELPTLKRFNTVFETIISVSPLLGLLGTILGLIGAFASLQIGDVGGSRTTGVTGGISEALTSTVMGLVVAIFTLLFANMFRGLYLRQLALIQEYGGQLELLYRRHYEKNKQGEEAYATAQ
ncbi:MotA/TolQ/ExbB proton channel family protein [Lusitaniella coriacea LEGE 07157]|uniref:MotA/TolQ/ExbB proton channel family protein n=1 Tax=Lusitaniella coriacea LEGE 07157 TaxID=945747 RepID=A0A8J7DZ62_9CYAN|nr:MotA/TolQ/ExbB proton channel family protein [Lusitaniella coriacea]MBE9118002.1 MotA/TolQ/ExbB proton channel family protein [Lusitaniella coriacea LEGE 07157]